MIKRIKFWDTGAGSGTGAAVLYREVGISDFDGSGIFRKAAMD
jgi:hypothetical protein